jgi:hypothetical protein
LLVGDISKNLRITLNVVLLTQVSFFDTIHFGKFDPKFFEGGGSFFIVRGEGFAMTTP